MTAAKRKVGDVFGNEEGFMEAAIAKLFLAAHDITSCPNRPLDLRAEVNSALRFQQIKSKPGTSSGFPCQRTGEYDVALTGYLTLVGRFGRMLDDDVRARIVNDLLNMRGPLPCATTCLAASGARARPRTTST
jgi:hypothetical protein